MNETSIYHEVHLPRNERRIHMLPGFFGGDGARARSGAAGGVQGGDMIEEPAVLVVGWTTTVFDHVSRRHAGDQVKRAAAFLQWLSARGLTLASCRQPDIDAWYAENNEHARNYSRPFLQWCMNSKLTGRFRLPQAVIRHAAPLRDHERVSRLGRILTAGNLPLRSRVAGAIVLLYAQPLSRIVRLSLEHVIRDGDEVLLRLGDPPRPVPGPVAGLLLSWIGSRTQTKNPTKPKQPPLVPGGPGSRWAPTRSPCWSTTSASPRPPGGHQRSASTSWRCPRPSWPTPSATTRSPPDR